MKTQFGACFSCADFENNVGFEFYMHPCRLGNTENISQYMMWVLYLVGQCTCLSDFLVTFAGGGKAKDCFGCVEGAWFLSIAGWNDKLMYAGFSWSTETVLDLTWISRVKYLDFLSRTLRGPE